MKKYLSDSEILNWNDRLQDTPYRVFPKYNSHSSFPAIIFKQIINKGYQEVITLDPHMKFSFSFSVAKNRVDNFFHIFNKWFSSDISTQTFYQDSSNQEKLSGITVSESIIKSKKEFDHKVKDKEYTKFTYEFEGRLSSIMAYVMFLEDTIEIFSGIWGYDETGSEHQLTKFSIGDIVCKSNDKSKDYIILDYLPHKTGYKKFILDYEVCKMITNGQIIQYSQPEIVVESKLCWSRDNRIDDILN